MIEFVRHLCNLSISSSKGCRELQADDRSSGCTEGRVRRHIFAEEIEEDTEEWLPLSML